MIRHVRNDKVPDHYTLRYLPGVDLNQRKHVHTLVRESFGRDRSKTAAWVAAEDARLALPSEIAALLEVVAR